MTENDATHLPWQPVAARCPSGLGAAVSRHCTTEVVESTIAQRHSYTVTSPLPAMRCDVVAEDASSEILVVVACGKHDACTLGDDEVSELNASAGPLETEAAQRIPTWGSHLSTPEMARQ